LHLLSKMFHEYPNPEIHKFQNLGILDFIWGIVLL